MKRNVEISFSEEFKNITAKCWQEVSKMIGYLSTWGIESSEKYAGTITIYGDHQGCLNASYRNIKGEVTFEICAKKGGDGKYTSHVV